MMRRNYTYDITYGSTKRQAIKKYIVSANPSELLRVSFNAILGGIGLRRGKKVFAIGMNKTATSSLHEVFISAGRLSYHGKRWRSGENMWLLHGFECFSDGPPVDFTELDRKFPGSLFVLNVREFDDWALSRLKHIQRGKILQPDRVYGPDWQVTEEAVEMWINHRDIHHSKVMRYFKDRPEQLCIVNFIRDSSATLKVANFIGANNVPDKPWANLGTIGGDPKHIELVSSVLKRLGISTIEAKRDLIVSPDADDVGLPTDTSEIND